MKSGAEAAEVWRGLYERIGTAKDDAEESIQQQSPLNADFRREVEANLPEMMKNVKDNPELDSEISMDELADAKRRLKRGAAAGPDLVPNSFLKLQGETATEALLLLLNRVWFSGVWPREWQHGTVLPLFKGGSGSKRTDVNDYRPITLTNAVAKLFETVLLARLTSWAEKNCLLVEEQGGFRKGRSTMDQIFTLHEIVAGRNERRLMTYMAFLDVRRAYDRVWRDGLLYKLLQNGISGRMFSMIRSMLELNKRTVVVQGAASTAFDTTVGLPQGAVLSPLLYALFINGLAETLKERHLGVWVSDRQVGILLYADDVVLVANSPEQLQLMLDCASDYAAQWQFRFNTKPGKSDVVVAPNGSVAGDPQFTLSGAALHVSNEYKYLGVEMGKSGQGCWKSYLHRARRKALAASNQLAYCVSGSRPLCLSTSVHLFKTLVWPVLEYGDAMWGAMCSEAGLTMMEQVQERFCRRIMRLPSSVAGEYVRRELDLPSMRQRVACASFKLFGHLAMLHPSRLAGFIFRKRCDQVDQGNAPSSWCRPMKAKLTAAGWANVWSARAVPDDWKERVMEKMAAQFLAQSQLVLPSMSTLSVFRRLGPSTTPDWLNRALNHPGAVLRLKLRCGGAPLMERVGASMKMDRQLRVCLMCDEKQVEDAEHFACNCPYYAKERADCVRRITEAVGGLGPPTLRNAMQNNALALFLGDGALVELPKDQQRTVDDVVCNFLKVAWRKRSKLWRLVCVDGNDWRLK